MTSMMAPRIKDVETPNPMQIKETLSTMSPRRPKIFLPKTGYSEDRIVSGKPNVRDRIGKKKDGIM